MIAVQDLTKVYGKRAALDHISFEVPEREIFGFVGPNGAGKTTTLRILAALLEPTEGKAFIDGADVTRDREKVHTRIGYMPDFFGVYDQLTVGEYLDFYAACYRQQKRRRQTIVNDLLALVGLTERKHQLVDTLSRGLKQRVCLARALVHDPAVLLLDEPASGLDPRARVEMREILKELQGMGKTIIISSHILPELTELCTMIGIIDHGRMRATGSVREVIARLTTGRRLRITVIEQKDAAIEVLTPLASVRNVESVNGTIEAEYEGDESTASDILFALTGAGIRVSSFIPVDGGLEDAFLKATSEEVG
ncbi:MAG: ABC transporter ATP-binding protein [Chloroflexi bacterium]|nr:MAG: ABC transporter [Actinobacteria bacterium 13_2_20CM_2_66_6]TMB80360.1 MAG: ABC transporter ATP-binding protein [Chloroflexota bacterium]TMF73894.1 MAG: ABC transporter ATP-binding protein [Chloroflexota bacterium]TMF77812.1 MAG: ABC transporter ATP-binding protein [Chloroflexota bacterium]TMG45990.1 MAG: ABC transporter ATP-binding protein [Chloroflexota bacterium]